MTVLKFMKVIVNMTQLWATCISIRCLDQQRTFSHLFSIINVFIPSSNLDTCRYKNIKHKQKMNKDSFTSQNLITKIIILQLGSIIISACNNTASNTIPNSRHTTMTTGPKHVKQNIMFRWLLESRGMKNKQIERLKSSDNLHWQV